MLAALFARLAPLTPRSGRTGPPGPVASLFISAAGPHPRGSSLRAARQLKAPLGSRMSLQRDLRRSALLLEPDVFHLDVGHPERGQVEASHVSPEEIAKPAIVGGNDGGVLEDDRFDPVVELVPRRIARLRP